MTSLLFRNVEVDGRLGDVHIGDGRIVAVAPKLDVPNKAEVIDGRGGALIPGLWDHHIHLVALAAARRSLALGPPDVVNAGQLAEALGRRATERPSEWIRAIGYHESVAGHLGRHRLDQLVADTPVRVQHRSGAMWMLNSPALAELRLDDGAPPGLERDSSGQPTGRIFGEDRWLRDRLGTTDDPPDLGQVGQELASYGVVGVTDATPYGRADDLRLIAEAAGTGALPQHVVAMGGPTLSDVPFPSPLQRGPVKLLLADHSLPSLDQLIDWIDGAHAAARPVAAHCVTRASLVLMLTALEEAGAAPGDRIEHGSVVPPELQEMLVRHRLTVVTQPNFVFERGDQYLTDVDPDDRPHLYPCASLMNAGVPVAGSTDAPFGHPDPWRAIGAAIARRTSARRDLGPTERLDRRRALRLFLGAPDAPGMGFRRIEPGYEADLCLLTESLDAMSPETGSEIVRETLIGGRLVGG